MLVRAKVAKDVTNSFALDQRILMFSTSARGYT
jgi:hypothetical protein